MKVVILAGGLGTRLSEFTEHIPKPMVRIGGKPILWHIMQIYSKYNHNDFIFALGYKGHVVRDYFLNYNALHTDFSLDLSNGSIQYHKTNKLSARVTLIDTGELTMTGGRLLRLREYIGQETFLLTYGDGLSNINIEDLVSFHRSHQKMVTVTAVRPPARFGELKINNGTVSNFIEKNQLNEGWINGGFFVVEPRFLDMIEDETVMLERQPLEAATSAGELMAYQHTGFWQCMDTKRDYDFLNKIAESSAPWL